MNRTTPKQSHNMRTNESRYGREKQQWQHTPKRNTMQYRYEQISTPMNRNYERNSTPERYNNDRDRRESERRYTERKERPTNTQTHFLDRSKQPQQFHQGVDKQRQQGVNNRYQQERTHGKRGQQQQQNQYG